MNDKLYKVVFCAPAIYSAGGVERVICVKANYFAEVLGYDVTIVVTEGSGRQAFFPVSDKVKVINLNLGFEALWHVSFLKKTCMYLKRQRQYRKKLTKVLMEIRPDFTMTVLRREINFINSVKDGSLKIGELHVNRANYRSFSADSNLLKRAFSWFWMKSLVGHLRQLDKMVVLTDSALNDWPELNHIVKIADPLPFRIDARSLLSQKRVVSVGRYAYDKGNDLLLRVWAKLEHQCPDWHLDIFGMGDRQPYLELLRQLGIDESRCRLHGCTSDVKAEYLNSSVFVLPSRFEGFGLVLVEAMACGLPAVSFDCENGPRSIITDGADGFLIPPFDTDAFARKLLLLMENPALRESMGAKAQQQAMQYDIDRVGQCWKQLFDDMKSGR